MTTKPVAPAREFREITQYPDPPPEEMTAYFSINRPGYPPSLAEHFGDPETTIITSEVAAALIPPAESCEGVRYPDLLIAFGVDPAANEVRKGYYIQEQGKPPDFVLEVASESSRERDEVDKREAYANMGVPEYWRFDPSGGVHYSTPLAGDRLVDGRYQPISIQRTDEGHFWGRSLALGLDLCWEEGELRFWDPLGRCYLQTFQQVLARAEAEAARAEAEAARAEAEAARAEVAESNAEKERQARAEAEARIRQLEAELRRRSSS